MPGTDLVSVASERQVRSYHHAFAGELTLYTLGGDLRPWRPLPARGIGWAFGIVLTVFVSFHVLGVSLAIGSLGWLIAYLVIPITFAYLFTVAKVEGRRLHVAVLAWIKHATIGYHLVGGVQRQQKAKSLGASRINLSEKYEPPRPLPVRRYATAALPLLMLVVTVWVVLNSGGSHASALPVVKIYPVHKLPSVRAQPIPQRAQYIPTLVKAVPHPVHRRTEHVARRPAERSVRKPPAKRSAVPIHIRPVIAAPIVRSASPVVTHVSPPPPTVSQVTPHTAPRTPVYTPAPHPQQTPCYPGQLGC